MVMQEAIKDKTLQVQKQMVDEQTGDVVAGHMQEGAEEEEKDSDSDFDCDNDVYYRDARDARIAQMKAANNEKLEKTIRKFIGKI